MKNLRITLALLLVGIIGISLSSMLLPAPADADIQLYYSPFATVISLVDVLTAVGCSILFFKALKNFKPELKPAYRLLAVSTLLVGLCLLIFPYIEYYGLWENTWFNMSSYLQYLLGAPLMYFGIRMFYRRVGLQGKVAKPLLVAGTILAVCLLHVFIPRDPSAVWGEFSTGVYDVWMFVPIIPAVFYLYALFMTVQLRRKAGEGYAKAFGWLTVGLVFYCIETISLVTLDTIGYDNWYFNTRFMTIWAILGDVSFLIAGYCFNAIGQIKHGESVWHRLFNKQAAEAEVTSMDIITYAVQMTADPSKLDDSLDDMRVITARHDPAQPLTAEEQVTLRRVYLAIEQYLVTDDPLRDFSKDHLRADITSRFNLDTQGGKTFWPNLGA